MSANRLLLATIHNSDVGMDVGEPTSMRKMTEIRNKKIDIRIQVFLVFVARLIFTPLLVGAVIVWSEELCLPDSMPSSLRARDDLKVGSCILVD